MFHMLIGQLFEPDQMEKDLSPWDLYIYKVVSENSMIHIFGLVMIYCQI